MAQRDDSCCVNDSADDELDIKLVGNSWKFQNCITMTVSLSYGVVSVCFECSVAEPTFYGN